jgi:hypothetical protein
MTCPAKAYQVEVEDSACGWADLTSEERSVEMKRRARVRKRNKAKARKMDVPSSR